MRRSGAPAALLALMAAALACAADGTAPARQVVLASTTSTEDSGLFDSLLPAFRAAYPQYDLKLIAVGSGQALELGRRRDADVLLVHAPAAESAFVAAGYAASRADVMFNNFLLVGPAQDPAGIRHSAAAADALRRIAAVRSTFISRGDDSGTHMRELQLWWQAGISPPATILDAATWYTDAGQGMAEVLRIASEKRAYTLADRATFLAMRDALGLEPLVEGDPGLFNPYSVITVAGARNSAGAAAFAEWITGRQGQALIRGYGNDRFSRPLFVPNARVRAGRADTPVSR